MKRHVCLMTVLIAFGWMGQATAQVCMVDNNSGDPADANSLPYCIAEANLTGGPFYIGFSFPAGSGPVDIICESENLITVDGVIIDGYSHPDAVANTIPAPGPLDTQLMISVSVLQDTSVFRGFSVFRIEASNTVIQGLNIHSGPLFAVSIGFETIGCQNNRIQGNFIGTDITGTAAEPSGWLNYNDPMAAGVYLDNRAQSNWIGIDLINPVPEPGQRNLISGEEWGGGLRGHGILVSAQGGGAPFNNGIIGNLIGTEPAIADTSTDPPTPLPLGNNYGITFYAGSNDNTVFGNVIAGNNVDGIWSGGTGGSATALHSGNIFRANYIGIDPNTDVAIANLRDGLHMEPGNQGFEAGVDGEWNMANFFSGNGRYGVYLYGAYTDTTSANLFTHNVVGMDTSGAFAVPNISDGIFVVATAEANTIQSNLISGNQGSGIVLLGASLTTIENNWIGRNFAGDTAQPNEEDGIRLVCTDVSCSDGNQLLSNHIAWNLGDGVSLWGPHAGNVIGNGSVIESNGFSGVFSLLADETNLISTNTVTGNGFHGSRFHGIEIQGGSPVIEDNVLLGNARWGVAVMPYYNGTYSPADSGDDVVAEPLVTGNTIDGNGQGGIVAQDTLPPNSTSLHTDNIIGDNNSGMDVLQSWFGTVELLDPALDPIGTGAYTVRVENDYGYTQVGDTSDGAVWGMLGIDADNIRTWFLLVGHFVDVDGNYLEGNPHVIRVTGPTGGTSSFTFDGADNDGANQGGLPLHVDTGGIARYQIAEVVTGPDSDGDGVADSEDCAPEDDGFQGIWGVACDADGDGYCHDGISGQVLQAACPNDQCDGSGLCVPTDCDDGESAIHPGQTEEAFGDAMCTDGDDNDCDTFVDIDDSGCWQCTDAVDCADANVCDGTEDCLAHVCVEGEPLDCNDDDPCTDDSCDAVDGCEYAYNTASCDDGLYCTVDDTCDGAGDCAGSARDCSEASDQCNDGVCDEGAGACIGQPLSNDTTCDDADDCTMNDLCTDGSCGGEPLDADDDGYVSDACSGNDCDDSSGSVHPGAPEGPQGDATCSDGVDNDCDGETDQDDPGCLVVEECGDGVLVGSEQCDDGNTDTGDGCDESCAVEAGWACRITIEPNLCGTAAASGDLVITEIMNDPLCTDDSAGEWIEVQNTTDHELVLRGWLVVDDDGDSHVLHDVSIVAGGTAVICRNADPAVNGNVTCDYQWAGVQLGNDDDELQFSDPADNPVDRVAWDAGVTFPDTEGASMSLAPGEDAASNDDGSNWCAADSAIIGGCGDMGTPAEINPACFVCPDADTDGYTDAACGGEDCDDSDPDIHPGADEICDDDIDQDCNGFDLECDCPDGDNDGFFADDCGGNDCDDGDGEVHPDATELCDNVDNDCDGETDEGFGELTCGAGACSVTVPECLDGQPQECTPLPPPEDPEVSCADTIDNDCDGYTDSDDLDCQVCPDADEDGYTSAACGGEDCNDNDDQVNPDAVEICTDNTDNDCDGTTDFDDEEDCRRGTSGCGCATSPAGLAGLVFYLLLGLALVRKRK